MSDAPASHPADAGNVRHQLLAAYLASGAKVLAWAVAGAIVYRDRGPGPFALLMLLRGTLGLFNHAAFGLGPAVLHFTALARRRADAPANVEAVDDEPAPPPDAAPSTLDYASRPDDAITLRLRAGDTPASVLGAAFVSCLVLGPLAYLLLLQYNAMFPYWHAVPRGVRPDDLAAVVAVGCGVLFRAAGDVAGGASQGSGFFTPDSLIAAAGDLAWAAWCLWIPGGVGPVFFLSDVAVAYAATGAFAAGFRWAVALYATQAVTTRGTLSIVYTGRTRFRTRLLAYGGLVTLGGVADFLYAPIDYVILNRLVDPLAVAVYAPAVQVDAALILLVTAVAAVVLPRSAIRHAASDSTGVWREYKRAALASAGVTLLAGVGVYLLSGKLFALWLGDPLPATRAVLPLVLAHTVIGATAGVGRATLLAVGKAGAYAASVLVGGLVNVALSVAFVALGYGLRGVIWGTLVSVFLRCVLWLPWYVRRTVTRP